VPGTGKSPLAAGTLYHRLLRTQPSIGTESQNTAVRSEISSQHGWRRPPSGDTNLAGGRGLQATRRTNRPILLSRFAIECRLPERAERPLRRQASCGRSQDRDQRCGRSPDRATGTPPWRKVRAPQDTVVGNAHRPRGSGQCHREQTADDPRDFRFWICDFRLRREQAGHRRPNPKSKIGNRKSFGHR